MISEHHSIEHVLNFPCPCRFSLCRVPLALSEISISTTLSKIEHFSTQHLRTRSACLLRATFFGRVVLFGSKEGLRSPNPIQGPLSPTPNASASH